MQEALNGTKVPDGSGTSLNIKWLAIKKWW
jgi:hypothetical protein